MGKAHSLVEDGVAKVENSHFSIDLLLVNLKIKKNLSQTLIILVDHFQLPQRSSQIGEKIS